MNTASKYQPVGGARCGVACAGALGCHTEKLRGGMHTFWVLCRCRRGKRRRFKVGASPMLITPRPDYAPAQQNRVRDFISAHPRTESDPRLYCVAQPQHIQSQGIISLHQCRRVQPRASFHCTIGPESSPGYHFTTSIQLNSIQGFISLRQHSVIRTRAPFHYNNATESDTELHFAFSLQQNVAQRSI